MDGLQWKTLLNMDDFGVPPFMETSISTFFAICCLLCDANLEICELKGDLFATQEVKK